VVGDNKSASPSLEQRQASIDNVRSANGGAVVGRRAWCGASAGQRGGKQTENLACKIALLVSDAGDGAVARYAR